MTLKSAIKNTHTHMIKLMIERQGHVALVVTMLNYKGFKVKTSLKILNIIIFQLFVFFLEVTPLPVTEQLPCKQCDCSCNCAAIMKNLSDGHPYLNDRKVLH